METPISPLKIAVVVISERVPTRLVPTGDSGPELLVVRLVTPGAVTCEKVTVSGCVHVLGSSGRTVTWLPVEVFGNTTHFDEYDAIARRKGLVMIEDCCEALGGSLAGIPAPQHKSYRMPFTLISMVEVGNN